MGQVKKILIIGVKGMAGHMFYRWSTSNTDWDVQGLARTSGEGVNYSLDLFDVEGLLNILDEGHFDYVVNCAGLLNQYAEEHSDEAIFINSYLPHFLFKTGKDLGFKLIHISTDCVFSGDKGNYRVDDFKDGRGFYAQSKALGEVIDDEALTIRTSIIGPELKDNGIGLLDWFLKQNGTIQGYTKSVWSGVTTLTLAQAIVEAINQDLGGIYQLTNNTPINKYDLLCSMKEAFNKDITIQAVEGKVADKSLINERTDFSFKVPSYATMLADLQVWMKEWNY